MEPSKGCGGGGRMLPSMVTVAVGAPGVPVICCAAAGTAMRAVVPTRSESQLTTPAAIHLIGNPRMNVGARAASRHTQAQLVQCDQAAVGCGVQQTKNGYPVFLLLCAEPILGARPEGRGLRFIPSQTNTMAQPPQNALICCALAGRRQNGFIPNFHRRTGWRQNQNRGSFCSTVWWGA